MQDEVNFPLRNMCKYTQLSISVVAMVTFNRIVIFLESRLKIKGIDMMISMYIDRLLPVSSYTILYHAPF